MKKFLLPALIITLLFMTGCGDSANDTIKVGAIKYLNVTEDELDKILNEDAAPSDKKRKHIFFENLSTMTAALQSGQIDEMDTYRTVALYLVNTNPGKEWEISEPFASDIFCCAVRAEDTSLKKEFDDAIRSLSKDGMLSKIVKAYIHDVTSSDIPPAVELPTFYGADTIKIGVTGDLPMLDYIRPDNQPAGFNTAVLAEISKRIGKNFVLVQIESGARALALTSKEVDVIFWAVTPKDGVLPINFDTPEGVILTEPYFTDDIIHVKLIK